MKLKVHFQMEVDFFISFEKFVSAQTKKELLNNSSFFHNIGKFKNPSL